MIYTTDAIVLRYADYRDADRMVTLMSPTLGRIDAIARGCRRVNSPLSGAVDVFCQGEYTINAANDRHSIVQCVVAENYFDLRLDYDRLCHGMYIISLADAATLPEQPCADLFVLLLKALAHLCYSDLPPALLTSAFETRFMALMGWQPQMERCVICGAPLDGDALFDEERGGVVCEDCGAGLPRITRGARRIIWRAAQTDYATVPKLAGHPDWPLAARLYRPFVLRRVERRLRVQPPPLPDDAEAGTPKENEVTT